MYKYKINTRHNLFLNTLKRYIHSKHKHHNLKNYKVFVDPFENLKNIQTVQGVKKRTITVPKKQNNNKINDITQKAEEIQKHHVPSCENSSKRARNHNAKKLPDFITELPKYVTYNNGVSNGTNQEYFRIEKHPKYSKVVCSSKSNKITVQEKYAQILEILEKINNGSY